MEITALCSRLLMFLIVLLAAHIQRRQTQTEAVHLTVNRLQFFEYESVSFLCDAPDGSTQLRGIRNNKEFSTTCDMKKTTLTCTIRNAYESDSGVYWCETGRGEKSNTVSITVTAGSVILESPAVPVKEGDAVTLRCRNKTTSTDLQADFFKDGEPMRRSSVGQITINAVSMSDEGLYNCSIPDVGASPGIWLAVRENHHVRHYSPEVLIPLCVGVLIMALLLLLLGFLHVRKHRVMLCCSSETPTNSGEDDQTENSADDPETLTYANIITKQRQNKDAADTADNPSLHLESNHSRKPQEDRDEDESVDVTLNISETPQAQQHAESESLNPTAADESSLTEQELLDSVDPEGAETHD